MSSPPQTIAQAQAALLQWEEQHPDEYVVCLLTLVGCSAATIRLAAMLSLKAAVGRRWKDRGRGKLVRGNKTSQQLLCEPIKHTVRKSILQLVLTGSVSTIPELHHMSNDYSGSSSIQIKYITRVSRLRSAQEELLQDYSLQTNAAALLGKIGKLDLPLKFHELIPSLVSGIQHCQEAIWHPSTAHSEHDMFRTIQINIMNVLDTLLAELSTRRLLIDKKYRNEVAKLHLGSVVEFAFIPALEADFSSRSILNYATSTSRVVSYFMVSSFSKLVNDPVTTALVEHIIGLIHKFLSYWLPSLLSEISSWKDGTRNGNYYGVMELLCTHCDFLVDLQTNHASSFSRYQDSFLSLFYSSFTSYIVEDMLMHSSLDRLVIAFLLFTAKAANSADNNTNVCEGGRTAINCWDSFFTPSLLKSLTRQLLLLISCHLRYNNDDSSEHEIIDKEYWHDSPEGFYQWELQRSSEDDVGCAAQNLFLTLIESSRGKEVMLPWFVEILTNVVAQQVLINLDGMSSTQTSEVVLASMPLGCSSSVSNLKEELVLQWDAVYTCYGLSGQIIENEYFNFDSFFNSIIGPGLAYFVDHELETKSLPIIRRRFIWLISCNAHKINLSSPKSPIHMLVYFLTKRNLQNDICVRLTAVQSIDALLPFCESLPEVIQSITQPLIPAVYILANQCNDVENKTACLEMISTLVTYVNVSGGELSDSILNTVAINLPSIWENAIDQNVQVKRNVLDILSCVASYVGPNQAYVLHPIALRMIDDSFRYENYVFLVKDALRLWYVFLQLSTKYHPMIGKLFIHTAKLSEDFEHVMLLAKIVEHYIIIGREVFLNEHAATLQAIFTNLVGEVSPRGQAYITLVTESLLTQFPVEGSMLLLHCGVVSKYIDSCILASSGSNDSESDRVIVMYLSTIARVFLAHPTAVGSFGMLSDLVSLYVSKFKIAGNGAHGLLFQKLWVLLLLSFYPPSKAASCSAIVLAMSSEILSMFTYIIRNVYSDGSNLLQYDVGFCEEEETLGENVVPSSPCQQFKNEDIVVSTNFIEVLSIKIDGLPKVLGDSYQLFLNNTDSQVLAELNNTIEEARSLNSTV